jgi:hypothetical protein
MLVTTTTPSSSRSVWARRHKQTTQAGIPYCAWQTPVFDYWKRDRFREIEKQIRMQTEWNEKLNQIRRVYICVQESLFPAYSRHIFPYVTLCASRQLSFAISEEAPVWCMSDAIPSCIPDRAPPSCATQQQIYICRTIYHILSTLRVSVFILLGRIQSGRQESESYMQPFPSISRRKTDTKL